MQEECSTTLRNNCQLVFCLFKIVTNLLVLYLLDSPVHTARVPENWNTYILNSLTGIIKDKSFSCQAYTQLAQ